MANMMQQIMEMKKELDYLKTILKVMKENEKLKKENEEMKANALLVYNPEWSGFEGKKLEAWTEYVTVHVFDEEIQIKKKFFEEFEYEYWEEESDGEEEEED